MSHGGGASNEQSPRLVLLGDRVAFTGKLASMTRRDALALVRDLGGRAGDEPSDRMTLLVVGMHGWPLLESGRLTRKLALAESMRAAGARIRILSEQAFRELVGLEPAPASLSKTHDAAQVSAVLGIDRATLERWDQLGLVQAHAGRYDFRDLVSLRTVADLVVRGVSPRVIRKSLEGLREILPGVEQPLAQLSILADSGRIRAEVGDALLAPDGQLELQFERRSAAPSEPRSLRLAPAAGDAGHWLAEGLAHEEAGRPREAERAYRRAIRIDPSSATAQFNLGNALLARGRAEAAAERFRQAAALDPTHAPSRFNLSHALEELRRPRAAAHALRRVVRLDPAYADAWFNLAALCEQLEDSEGAERGWKEYLRLDPSGAWADEARRRLEALRRPSWA
jgi:tetratricopeptide (TPR) repeat protein